MVRSMTLAVVASLLLVPSGPAHGQEASRDTLDRRGDRQAVSPDSAAVLREAMERPADGHPIGVADVVNAPFRIVFLPLKLVGDATVWAVGEIVEVEPAGELKGLARSLRDMGIRPGISTGLGPRGGLGLELVYVGLEPLLLETAVSHRGSQRHGVGLRWGGEARRLTLEGTFRRYAEPWVWGIGMDVPDDARADYQWDRVAATATLELARRDRTVHDLFLRLGVEENSVEDGGDDDLPGIQEVFPPGALPGARDLTRYAFVESRGELDLLDRDPLEVTGLRARAGVEGYEGIGGTATRFLRLGTELEGLVPVTERHVLGARLRAGVSREDGGNIPFTHLLELGGDEGLRAYRSGRFRGRDLFLVGAEWRWELWRSLREEGALEAFAFYTEGGVSHDLTDDFPDLASSGGAGVRFLWMGEYQGEGYLAFGEYGPRVSASLELDIDP